MDNFFQSPLYFIFISLLGLFYLYNSFVIIMDLEFKSSVCHLAIVYLFLHFRSQNNNNNEF